MKPIPIKEEKKTDIKELNINNFNEQNLVLPTKKIRITAYHARILSFDIEEYLDKIDELIINAINEHRSYISITYKNLGISSSNMSSFSKLIISDLQKRGFSVNSYKGTISISWSPYSLND